MTASAAGLIVAGVVNFVCGGIWMAAGLSVLHDEVGTPEFGGATGVFAYIVVFAPAVLSVISAPASVMGGVQMLRRATRGLTVAGAVAAIVPVTSFCFPAGIPLGIWVLVTLRRPDTKAWYAGVMPGTGLPGGAGYPGPGPGPAAYDAYLPAQQYQRDPYRW